MVMIEFMIVIIVIKVEVDASRVRPLMIGLQLFLVLVDCQIIPIALALPPVSKILLFLGQCSTDLRLLIVTVLVMAWRRLSDSTSFFSKGSSLSLATLRALLVGHIAAPPHIIKVVILLLFISRSRLLRLFLSHLLFQGSSQLLLLREAIIHLLGGFEVCHFEPLELLCTHVVVCHSNV